MMLAETRLCASQSGSAVTSAALARSKVSASAVNSHWCHSRNLPPFRGAADPACLGCQALREELAVSRTSYPYGYYGAGYSYPRGAGGSYGFGYPYGNGVGYGEIAARREQSQSLPVSATYEGLPYGVPYHPHGPMGMPYGPAPGPFGPGYPF